MTESELLAALIHHCGGELRIERLALEQIAGCQVVADIAGNEIILRLTTNRVQIFPKCQDRTQPTSISPISVSPTSPTTHSVLNEDKLKQLEAEKVKQEKLRQWQEQSAQVLSQMPVPSKSS